MCLAWLLSETSDLESLASGQDPVVRIPLMDPRLERVSTYFLGGDGGECEDWTTKTGPSQFIMYRDLFVILYHKLVEFEQRPEHAPPQEIINLTLPELFEIAEALADKGWVFYKSADRKHEADGIAYEWTRFRGGLDATTMRD